MTPQKLSEKLTIPIKLAGEPQVYSVTSTGGEPSEYVKLSDYQSLQTRLKAAEGENERLRKILNPCIKDCYSESGTFSKKAAIKIMGYVAENNIDPSNPEEV